MEMPHVSDRVRKLIGKYAAQGLGRERISAHLKAVHGETTPWYVVAVVMVDQAGRQN